MYVINGIPEFRKMGTGIPIFDLNGFRVFRFDFPPESSGIPNSEAEFRIPVVPGNGIPKRNSQPRGREVHQGLALPQTPKNAFFTPPFMPISAIYAYQRTLCLSAQVQK